MTTDEATRIIALLLDGFRPKDWSIGSTRVYVRTIEDLEYDAAQVAAVRLLQTEKFMPRVADLRRSVYRVMHPDAITPGEAWQQVMREISRVGSYGTPRFDDQRVAAAVNAVGWRAICMSEVVGVERAHFMRAYEAFVNRDEEHGQIGVLVHAASELVRGETTKALEPG